MVARRQDGASITQQLLSVNPERYADAALQGIPELLELDGGDLGSRVPAGENGDSNHFRASAPPDHPHSLAGLLRWAHRRHAARGQLRGWGGQFGIKMVTVPIFHRIHSS